MEHDNTECQPPPEAPVLCINNCGFFGSAATMNMCSKCHKDMLLKQSKLASSMEDLINGTTNSNRAKPVDVKPVLVEPSGSFAQPVPDMPVPETSELPSKARPNRCSLCKKRVGLTGFNCRCGEIFCGAHRYSDKHNCCFDYRAAGRSEIARANPVVKAEKLDKI